MARKALLTETEIRRFLKLAKLNAVNDTRLHEIGAIDERGEEDHLEDELEATEDELGAEDHVADEEGSELDALEMGDELDAEDDLGAEAGGLDAELEDMLAQGVEALAAAWGIEDRVDVEGGEGGEDLEEPLPDDGLGGEEEVAMDVDVEAGPDGLEVGAEEEEEEVLPGGRMYQEEKIVAEVARRVVERLAANQKKQTLSDELAERILKRLTSK